MTKMNEPAIRPGTVTRWPHDGKRMFAKDYRMLSFVPRWSIAPRLHQQSDAEHCFYVALYASQLCDFFSVPPEQAVWIVGWALRHDAPEIWTGDPPGPAKAHFIDEAKLAAYIDRFAQHVDDFKVYRDMINLDSLNWTSFNDQNRTSSKDFRTLVVRIIKVADLVDECFYLRYELAMGNVLVKDLFQLSLDRLRAKVEEWGTETAEYLIRCVQMELAKIETEGALIPTLK